MRCRPFELTLYINKHDIQKHRTVVDRLYLSLTGTKRYRPSRFVESRRYRSTLLSLDVTLTATMRCRPLKLTTALHEPLATALLEALQRSLMTRIVSSAALRPPRELRSCTHQAGSGTTNLQQYSRTAELVDDLHHVKLSVAATNRTRALRASDKKREYN